MRGISSLTDKDMEDPTQFVDENLIISTASESELPKQKGARSKTADNRISKPRTATRKPSAFQGDGARKAVGRAAGTKRKALEEQVNGETQQATKKSFPTGAARSGDELEGLTGGENSKKEANVKPKRKAKPKKDTATRGDDSGQNPAAVQQTHIHNGSESSTVVQNVPTNDPQHIVGASNSNTTANIACSPQRPMKSFTRRASRSRQESVFRRRAGSASDTERGCGDPNLRRKLGDLTRKLEDIELKYRSLKEVGILEASANMEKLRKQCEATTSASSELIASLKRELTMQMPLAHETRQLQIDLRTSRDDAKKMRSAVSDLESSLVAAQNEIKAQQAKLAAARSSAPSVESVSARIPGSAIKNSSQARTVMVGSAETAQAVQTAQLKQDLYSDLTGLIIRSVKRTEDGDAYDCIQTGRNGSKCLTTRPLQITAESSCSTSFQARFRTGR